MAITLPTARQAATRRRERTLFVRYHEGDFSVRDELVESFMPLARSIAHRYSRSSEPFEDLEQVAYVGLLKAIDRYDPAAGSFVGFAIPSISGELKRHFRDHAWGLHVPRPVQQRYLEVSQAADRLHARTGRAPTVHDLAGDTELSVEEVAEALDAGGAYSPVPLDAPRSDEQDAGVTLADQLGDVDPRFDRIDDGTAIAPTFRALPRREQKILHLRFFEDLHQSEIAERLGISQMHVSRLLRRSLDKLSTAAGA